MNTKKIVLYAEDDLIQSFALEKSLSKYFDIFCVKNVELAKKHFDENSNNIALILTDYNMKPGENGLELARYVKSKSDIPVILLTGIRKYACEDDNFEFCDLCIDKGQDVYQTIRAIEDLTSR